jgi:hypothetical protein
VNQTRKISISDRVFTIEDLRRVAAIFDKQSLLAKKSDHDASVKYSVTFSDDTTYESDSPDLFSEGSLAVPARPVEIKMSFRNYKLGRHISLSLSHGDSSYGNVAVVSANEPEWLRQNFLTLEETLQTVRPQTIWLRRHRTLLLNLIAVGIGSLGMWVVDLLTNVLTHGIDLSGIIKPLPPDSPWRRVISDGAPLLYGMKWMWYWVVGFFWGAFAVRGWLLRVWPSIEFDFGLAHLKTERKKRRRLLAVATLIVIPIIRSIIYDVMKSRF